MNDEQAKHNPPAFPLEATGGGLPNHFQGGMSLRDYFAGQAMAGMLACQSGREVEKLAKDSYLVADELLAERAKAGGGK